MPYFGGWLIGFVAEQVLVAFALAATGVGAAALASKAMTALRAPRLVAFANRVVDLIKAIAFVVQLLAQNNADRSVIRQVLGMLRESGETLAAFWAKYPRGTNLLRLIATTAMEKGIVVAKVAWKWLPFIDRMTDPTAQRFVRFVTRRGADAAESWMTRWTVTGPNRIKNGKRAVSQALEAAEKFDELSDSAQHLLVATADVAGDAGETVAKQLAQRYSQQQLDEIAAAVKRNISDERFSDAAIGRVGQLLAHPDVPLHTPAQAEGLAKIIAKLCK